LSLAFAAFDDYKDSILIIMALLDNLVSVSAALVPFLSIKKPA
jgi:hypothetical protein